LSPEIITTLMPRAFKRRMMRSISAPALEIHITNIEKRGYGSITSEAAIGMIAGFGVDSYVLALEAMVSRLRAGK
jgi:3-dehydroquinate dehydratase-2